MVIVIWQHKANSGGPQHWVLVRQIHMRCAAWGPVDIWAFEFKKKKQCEDPQGLADYNLQIVWQDPICRDCSRAFPFPHFIVQHWHIALWERAPLNAELLSIVMSTQSYLNWHPLHHPQARIPMSECFKKLGFKALLSCLRAVIECCKTACKRTSEMEGQSQSWREIWMCQVSRGKERQQIER